MLAKKAQLPNRAIRAHAIKNCLAIITAVNRLLEPVVGDTERGRLSRSQNAVKRLLELIEEDLLPNNDSLLRRVTKPIVTAQVLGAVRARVEDLARARKVRLSFQVGLGSVNGDFRELVEALLNIVINAIDSTPSGGVVVVTSRADADGGQIWTIEDEGPGIPKHLLSDIGTPFMSRRPGGSGLGVAVARGTVERHGGRLDIQSVPGLGTLVTIHLLRQPAGNAERPSAQAPVGSAQALEAWRPAPSGRTEARGT